jgi:hypothetical protein
VYVLQNNESGFPLIFTITGGIVILPLNWRWTIKYNVWFAFLS